MKLWSIDIDIIVPEYGFCQLQQYRPYQEYQ